MRQHLIQTLQQLATDRWARRGTRILLRAAWLSVSIWCIGLGGQLLWGWQIQPNLLVALALAAIGVGLALLLRPRLSPQAAARRLDRRYHLDEQLATATEVAASNPPPGSVAARLLAESSQTAELLRRRIARSQQPPWNDLITLGMLGLVALGLLILTGIGAPNLGGPALPIPPLAAAQNPAQELPNQPPQNQQPGAPEPAATEQAAVGDPQVIQVLADALRDQGVTRPAATALDQGDLPGAASQLRALADQASQLTPATRQDVADALRRAADQIGERNQALTDQLESSARGLEQGGQPAAQALDELARAIEQLETVPSQQPDQANGAGQGAQPGQPNGPDQSGQANGGEQGQGQDAGQGNGSGAGNGPGGEQRQADPSGRLGVEGQPVPLESSGTGDLQADPSGPLQSGSGETKPDFVQGDSSSNKRVEAGADPLRVPVDERDVVQEYFQP